MKSAATLLFVFAVGLSPASIADENFDEIDNLIELLEHEESQHGEFHIALFEPLMLLAEAHLDINDTITALDYFQRAQHISHRNEGVYSTKQLEIIRQLTNLALLEGDFDQADQQQRFSFFVERHHFEDQIPQMLTAYNTMADWYMFTGQPRRARRLLSEALEIAEDAGINTLPIAIRINKTRRLEGICCRTRELEETIANNRDSDADMLVTAYEELGDTYLVSGRSKRANQWYLKAYELSPLIQRTEPRPISNKRKIPDPRLQNAQTYKIERDRYSNRLEPRRIWEQDLLEDEALEPQWFVIDGNDELIGFTHPDIRSPEASRTDPEQLIGHPILFREDQLDNLLSRRLSSRKDELKVTVTFDIMPDGDLENIEIVSTDTPNRLKRLLVNALRKVYFRPAMVNGVPVTTTGYVFTQTFKPVLRKV